MKKIFSVFVFVAVATFSFAQNANNLLDPTTMNDGTNAVRLSVTNAGAAGADFQIQGQTGQGRTRLQILPNGSDTRAFIEVLNSSNSANAGLARLGARGNYGIFSVINQGTPATSLKNIAIELDPLNTQTGEAFVITTGAFLVDGTPTFLAKVNGSGIETIEAKVLALLAAPDYVFEEDYNLPSLEEVEAYIKANKHLPEIPSAAEFEANGIQLGKMSFDLLKKVEELTLYMIELKKENEALKARVEALEK
jgi:hypothetical protein